MSQTVDTIVQGFHAEFESMLNYVTNSQTATADQMERGLFRRLLSLGLRLMLLFFALRTAAAARDQHQVDNDEPLPYWDAAAVEAFYAQLPPPPPSSEAALLVIQADGKGVPMLRPTPATPQVRLGKGEKPNRKKEAVVAGVYTIASHPRTPAEVVASLFHPERTPVAPPAPRIEASYKHNATNACTTSLGPDKTYSKIKP